MSARVSAKRKALAGAMQTALADGWQEVAGRLGLTVRWDRTRPFPDRMRDYPGVRGGKPYANWGPDYTQHVFVTDLGFGSPILRVAPAPWVEARDQAVSLTRALEILTDPAAVLDREGARP